MGLGIQFQKKRVCAFCMTFILIRGKSGFSYAKDVERFVILDSPGRHQRRAGVLHKDTAAVQGSSEAGRLVTESVCVPSTCSLRIL